MLKIKGHLFFSSVIVLGLACFVPPRELRCMLGSKPGFCFSNYTEKKPTQKMCFSITERVLGITNYGG